MVSQPPEPSPASEQATVLLNRLVRGDEEAARALLPLLYAELHDLAAAHMKGQPASHTLQPTALLHEAWLKLVRQEGASFDGRARFYALASRTMRSILVDHARARGAARRTPPRSRLTLSEAADGQAVAVVDVLELDELLQRLSSVDPELARLVELRVFGGLSHPEVARVLDTSLRSVERNWRLARAWLQRELGR
jgi:RNA polymerase sigma factor (TIGR02999 family)